MIATPRIGSGFTALVTGCIVVVLLSVSSGVLAQDIADVPDDALPAEMLSSSVGTYRASTVPQRTWASVEYLRWWIKGNDLPPLVTTSPLGTPRTEAGVLGPGTEVLFGDDRIDTDDRPGVRATIGRWLDDDASIGIQASWVSVFDTSGDGDFFIQSDGDPIIARPFFDAVLQQNASELTAYTDPLGTTVAEGSVGVRTSSELHSASLLLRSRYRQGPRGRIDLLGGYRYLRFHEHIAIAEQVIARDPGGLVPVGTTFDLDDDFRTGNQFHGAELGVSTEFYYRLVNLQLVGKLAMGNIRQKTEIRGATTVSVPPPIDTTSTSSGGLLSQPTNIGTRVDNKFAVLPEFGINIAVPLTQRCTFTTGYSLLLLNHVARSGEQIDSVINSTQIGGNPLVGPARPHATHGDSDFWVQGLQFGLTFVR